MLCTLLERSAVAHPNKVAIRHDSQTITYSALVRRVRMYAAALAARGVSDDTVVIVCLDNGIDTLVAMFALASLGARLVPVDATSKPDEIRRVHELCRPKLVLTQSKHSALVDAALSPYSTDSKTLDVAELASDFVETEPFGERTVTHGGPFAVLYTSGSTGRPKGIVLTQESLCHRLENWIETARLSSRDEHLCPLTLTHVYGCHYAALPALASGGTLHLMDPLRLSPQRVLRYVSEHAITCFYALPYFYQLMASVPRGSEYDVCSLRLAMCAAAPLSSDAAGAFLERFGVPLNNCYGLSEVGLITANLDANAARSSTTIGLPVHGIQVRQLASSGADGAEEGELVVRGATLADGFFAAEDGEMLRDGWLHTGDLVSRDSDGRFHIVGRISQFINVAGNKVMPAEIEAVLAEFDGVHEVAVVGVPDSRTTQKIAAFVVVSGDVTVEGLRSHCSERLTSFKVPHFFEMRPSLPKSALGKILKADLKLASAL